MAPVAPVFALGKNQAQSWKDKYRKANICLNLSSTDVVSDHFVNSGRGVELALLGKLMVGPEPYFVNVAQNRSGQIIIWPHLNRQQQQEPKRIWKRCFSNLKEEEGIRKLLSSFSNAMLCHSM